MTTATIKFNSIAQLGEYVTSHQQAGSKLLDTDCITSGEWCGAPHKEALQTTNNGGLWQEGAKEMEPVDLDMSHLSISDLALPIPEPAMQGYRPNVAAYLAGSPQAMWKQQPDPQPNRLLKIAVHVGRAEYITQEQAFNRGNAILSVINALATNGMAVELWAIWRNQSDSKEVSIETLIKSSEASWSPDSVAFALANVAYQRRINWNVLNLIAGGSEGKQAEAIATHVVQNGYGNGKSANFSDFDLSFPYMIKGRWDSKSSALDIIVRETNEQLTNRGTS